MTSKQFLPYLEAYIKTRSGIESSWNGEDDSGEEEATIAGERKKAAEDLREVILTYDL